MGLDTKLILALVVVVLLGGAAYFWRADIKSAVYEQVYADQVKEALKEKQDEIDRLNRINGIAQNAIVQAQQDSAKLQQSNDQLKAQIGKLSGTVSPGLGSALEAVQQMGRTE